MAIPLAEENVLSYHPSITNAATPKFKMFFI